MRPTVRQALAAGADAVLVVALRPHVGQLGRDLGAPHAWFARVGVDRALVELSSAALWLAALWFAVGLGALGAAGLPGAAGRCGRRVSRSLLPTVVHRALAGSAGLGLLLAPVLAPAAAQAAPRAGVGVGVGVVHAALAPTPGMHGSAASAPALPSPAWPTSPPLPAPTWPTTSEPTGMHASTSATPDPGAPAPTWPTDARPGGGHASTTPHAPPTPRLPAPAWPRTPVSDPGAPPTAPTTAPTTAPPADVRVQAGDSLWLLAARRLGPHPSAVRIAHEWPRWYAANRAAIGPDPDRLVPGTVLHAPPDPPTQEAP